jgi:hypothetical protein
VVIAVYSTETFHLHVQGTRLLSILMIEAIWPYFMSHPVSFIYTALQPQTSRSA